MKLFDSTTIAFLSKALSAYALRQQTTAANIANIDTAGYRTQAVKFQAELQSASQSPVVSLAATDKNHITPSSESIEQGVSIVDAASAGLITDDPYASGVNNVDIDHEMSEMAETQYRFKYASRMMAETFRSIEKSIKGQAT